jgi:hypothetical protein
MTALLARPAHWDDPDPVPGFALQRRRVDLGVGEVWEAVSPDGGPVLLRLVDLPDDAASRAKAGRLAQALPLLAHPDLEPVRRVVATVDGLALVRPPAVDGATTLSALLARRRSISAAEVAGLADRLGRALGHLHDNGVTHGRLAAGDVLLRPNGHPLLTGFGVAGIQGAGGRPAGDIAALATLLLSVLATRGGPESQAVRAVLDAATAGETDGHDFADEVLRCSDPAPVRMRPSPRSRLAAVPMSSSRAVQGPAPDVFPEPLSASSTAKISAVASPASFPPTSFPPTSFPPADTLDAAVRALRAGARQSADRPRRRQPARRGGQKPRAQPARHLASPESGSRTSPSRWLWRVVPAAAILLVTVAVGWRFVGPAASADARPIRVSTTVPAPDRATIARLDAARAAAFAAGVAARLTAADAPGSSALAADVDAMSIMLSHGGRARGLAPRLYSVTLLNRTSDEAAVRVVDEVPPYDFVTPAGQIIARAPGHGRQVHEVRLRLVSGQWRYAAVGKPPESASSAGGAS